MYVKKQKRGPAPAEEELSREEEIVLAKLEMEKDEIAGRIKAIKNEFRAKQKDIRAVKGIPEDETKVAKGFKFGCLV